MRHRKHSKKLGRTSEHRQAMISSLVVALIKHRSIKTTVAKAKVAAQTAEKLVTLARKDTLASRRLIASRLRDEEAAAILCKIIAPATADRPGGYTRVVKMAPRRGDAAQMAILQWVDNASRTEAKAEA